MTIHPQLSESYSALQRYAAGGESEEQALREALQMSESERQVWREAFQTRRQALPGKGADKKLEHLEHGAPIGRVRPEAKSYGGGDENIFENKMDQICGAIEDFKGRHQGHLADLRTEMDELHKKVGRGRRFDQDNNGALQMDETLRPAWLDYLRKGDESIFENKALSAGSNPDGGYLIPAMASAGIVQKVFETSPMRAICSVQETKTTGIKLLLDRDQADSGWVGEQSARPETNTPRLGEIEIRVHEIFASPKASQNILDDSFGDLENWINGKIADRELVWRGPWRRYLGPMAGAVTGQHGRDANQ